MSSASISNPGATASITSATAVSLSLGSWDVQVADIAARAAYDGSAAGFSVLVSDTGSGRAAVYTKNSATSADWSDPAYYTGPTGATGATGPAGADGIDGADGADGNGFAWRSDWALYTDYIINDVAHHNNVSYVCVATHTANNNDEPGVGAGWDAKWDVFNYSDMLASTYDPTSVAGDAFAMDNMAEGTDTKIMTAVERGKLSDIITPEMFGAVGDGTTDDTAAFQDAIDALPTDGGTITLTKQDYKVTIGSLSVGSKDILWSGGNKINSVVYRQLPGVNESFAPGSTTDRRRVFYEHDAYNNAYIRYDYYRNANYSGGTTGVNSVMRVYANIGSSVGTSGQTVSEWPFQARVDNNSDLAEGVALTGQCNRVGLGASWAGHFNAVDQISADSSTRNIWGIEANIQADGVDTNNRRIVIGVIAHNSSASYSGVPGTDVVGSGLNVYPDTADYSYGVNVRTLSGAGSTTGEYRIAALRISAKAPSLIAATHPSSTGVVRVGSESNSGIVAQILGIGNNSSSSSIAYTDTRSEIDVNTAGSEKGRWRLYVINSGSSVEYIRVNAGSATPIMLNVSGTLKAVTEGATDSGGTGYKVLRVPN